MNISYSELRQDLKITIDTGDSEGYEFLEETAFLLKHPKMAKRLLEAVSGVKEGKIMIHDLMVL